MLVSFAIGVESDDSINLILSNLLHRIAAKSVEILRKMKMTHILNAAYSEKHSFLYVNTSQNYYRDRKFECNFLGLSAVDCPTYKLSKYFQQASDFIDLALSSPQGND